MISLSFSIFHFTVFTIKIKKVFQRYLTQTGYTWREEGCEIVEDLRVPLPSCETHHRAHVQRERPQLLPRAQAVHFQHVFHVVEETHKQEAGVRTGRKHCSRRCGKVTIWISVCCSIQILQSRWSKVLQKLTNNILVMLRDELFPVARIRRSKVDIDEAITWSVQVGLEGEQCVLVGDILVFGVKIVNELHPRQKSYTYKQFCYSTSKKYCKGHSNLQY